MLGGKCRHRRGPSYLRAAGDGDHDGRLLLTFLRCLDLESAAASDDGEDVEEVDGEHGIKKHLAVAFRHVIMLQPTIHDDEVFDLDREARRLTASCLAGIA